MTGLIGEEQMIADPKKRIVLLQQARKIQMEDVPFAPLFTISRQPTARRRVSRWKTRPDEKVLGWDMNIK
jgi:ABC-type oligopeptide transport system substrate-binding subunit